MVIRTRARAWGETINREELGSVLEANPSARLDVRRGDRHGTRDRTLTTSTIRLQALGLDGPQGLGNELIARLREMPRASL
jgi:hypothetical protein